jgi:hypothetical protein
LIFCRRTTLCRTTMGEGNETTSPCQGHEQYGYHCTHNGPSARVWFDIFIAAVIIFGFFFWHLKWSERSRHTLVFEWNNHDDDSTDMGSSYDNDIAEKRQGPYYHMHPALSRSQKSLQAAKNWISDRFSSQRSINSKEQQHHQQQQLNQSDKGLSYTAPATSTTDAEVGQASNSDHNGPPEQPGAWKEGGSTDVAPSIVALELGSHIIATVDDTNKSRTLPANI